MNIGIMGAGAIAHVLAKTMVKLEGICLYAIGSRSLEKAKEFAEEYGIKNAYGTYEELVEDEAIDLVYIATPHSHHYECMKLCINAKKAVLCEKAFTVNAKQAKEIATLAKEKNVYVAEAIWTRYMPSRSIINELLASKIIGEISMATANLSYDIDKKPRLIDPNLAGGALLDVGVYGLNFFAMHLGMEIDHIESSVQMTNTGVDGRESITIFYKDGKMAVSTHGIYGRSDRRGIFYGEKGYIVVDNINNPNVIRVYDLNDTCIREEKVPKQISGYEYEILEAKECIEKGRVEAKSMSLLDSIDMMEIMDSIRRQWGLSYPMENE